MFPEPMKIEDLYFEDNSFGKLIQEWASSLNITSYPLESKSSIDTNVIDGLIIFHENHDISKFHNDLIDLFNSYQIGISKIDINGTLSVASSNFGLWMDRNRPKHLLVVGDDKLSKNENAVRFLKTIDLH